MIGKIVKVIITDMYPIEMNGIAIAGWITAAVYGVGALLIEIWNAFQGL